MNKKTLAEIFEKLEKCGGKARFNLEKGIYEIEFPKKNLNSSLDVKLDEDEIVIEGFETSVEEKYELMKKIWDDINKRKREFSQKKMQNDMMVL